MRPTIIAFSILLLTTAACEPVVATRGYVQDPDRLSAVSVGTSTREDVLNQLGTPTQVSTFDENTWYYFGRNTEQYSFLSPTVIDQNAIEIKFNDDGVVAALNKLDSSESREISPVARSTPTYGKETTIFEQLLGNMGNMGNPTARK